MLITQLFRTLSSALTLALLGALPSQLVAQCSTTQEVGNNLVINGDFEDPTQTFTTDYADQLYRFPDVNN